MRSDLCRPGGWILGIAVALVAGFLFPSCQSRNVGDLQIAVAGNFAGTMTEIASRFERETNVAVSLSFGSTGKHYAQIKNGAPFDLFFAADVERPTLLESEGVAVPGSRFTYARGRLVLWSPDDDLVDSEGRVLYDSTIRFIAIANPELAPYGRAAREVLETRGLWNALAGRIVRGENISQSFQFAKSGNADLGFVAYSQVMRNGRLVDGSAWVVPDSLYRPIEQQAVLIRDSETARRFLAFFESDQSRQVILDFGYDIP